MRSARRAASGKIRKEAAIPTRSEVVFWRGAGALVAAFAILAGCGGPTKKAPPKATPVLKHPITVETANGDATIRSIDGARRILYHVVWQKAELNAADTGIFAGALDDVSGEIYDDHDVVGSSFKADSATANKEKNLLTLFGHVQLVSKTQAATITCDKLEWHAGEKLARAVGHVMAVGQFGTIGPADEMWSDPKLKVISTPDLIKHP